MRKPDWSIVVPVCAIGYLIAAAVAYFVRHPERFDIEKARQFVDLLTWN